MTPTNRPTAARGKGAEGGAGATKRVKPLFAASAVCVLAVGLAIAMSPATAAQSDNGAANYAGLFRFAQAPVPVPVVKTADGQTTLATVQWGYNATHNICYLILDYTAIAVLRANAASITGATPPQDESAATRCHIAYNPQRGFARQPVPVVKTPDGETTLATVQWGYNATYNICYLVLDDQATTILRTAAEPPPPADDDQPSDDPPSDTPPDDPPSDDPPAEDDPPSDDPPAEDDPPSDDPPAEDDPPSDDPADDPPTEDDPLPPADPPSPISAGGDHVCQVMSDSSIQCWGSDYYGQSSAPDGQFTAVSAGGRHTCGLRTDQTIQCWGSNNNEQDEMVGQANAPEGTFLAVSAGGTHTCGLRTDQTIQCWGNNRNWQDEVVGQAQPPRAHSWLFPPAERTHAGCAPTKPSNAGATTPGWSRPHHRVSSHRSPSEERTHAGCAPTRPLNAGAATGTDSHQHRAARSPRCRQAPTTTAPFGPTRPSNAGATTTTGRTTPWAKPRRPKEHLPPFPREPGTRAG